jgi:inner membrane transporter RhtA
VAVRDRAQAQGVAADRVPPVVLVLGGVASIQFGAAIAATLFDDVGAEGVSLLRLGFAALVLVAIWQPRPSEHARGDLALAAVFGLVLGAMNLTFYMAIDRIPLGIAVTIEFVGPLAVAVLGSRRRMDLLWVVLAAAGILLLAAPWGEGRLDALGVLLALVAGGFWGAYILIAQRAGQRFRGGTGLALAMIVAAMVPLGPGLAVAGSDLLGLEILAIGAGVALLSSVVPYSLETEALRRMPSSVFGVLMSLEPAAAALFGFAILEQDLVGRELLGIAAVVVASAGASRTGPPPPAPPEP